MHRRKVCFGLTVMAAAFCGCEPGRPSGSHTINVQAPGRDDVRHAAQSAASAADRAGQDFQNWARPRLKELDRKIDDLKARAKDAEPEVRKQYDKTIHELSQKRDALARKLDELRDRTAEAWPDVRKGFEQAFHDLHGALDRAADKFHKN